MYVCLKYSQLLYDKNIQLQLISITGQCVPSRMFSHLKTRFASAEYSLQAQSMDYDLKIGVSFIHIHVTATITEKYQLRK